MHFIRVMLDGAKSAEPPISLGATHPKAQQGHRYQSMPSVCVAKGVQRIIVFSSSELWLCIGCHHHSSIVMMEKHAQPT